MVPTPPENPHRGPDPVALELQRLFMPPDHTSAPGALQPNKPPVLRRISDHRRHLEAQEQVDPKDKPFPRLYPSIRLAMREIQQVQQVRKHVFLFCHVCPFKIGISQCYGFVYLCSIPST